MPTTCKDCQSAMTWAEQRRQFARLLSRGFSREEAKALLPRCQKCVTAALREHPERV